MRFVNIYLVGYFLLVMGAVAALWYAGSCARFPDVDRDRARYCVWPWDHAVGFRRQARDHARIVRRLMFGGPMHKGAETP